MTGIPRSAAANAPPASVPRLSCAWSTNPPFPFTVWPMGGTPWIGYPNATQYPSDDSPANRPAWRLVEEGQYPDLRLGGSRDEYQHVRTTVRMPMRPPLMPQVANSFMLDQLTLYIERTPDTIQTDHFDWGFRLTNLYGFDYRFTTAEGYFSQQLLNNPKANGTIGNKYGYDPVMAYVDLYFPHVAEGMDVRIGRYISLPDIEAQLAPNNYTYTPFADLHL